VENGSSENHLRAPIKGVQTILEQALNISEVKKYFR